MYDCILDEKDVDLYNIIDNLSNNVNIRIKKEDIREIYRKKTKPKNNAEKNVTQDIKINNNQI